MKRVWKVGYKIVEIFDLEDDDTIIRKSEDLIEKVKFLLTLEVPQTSTKETKMKWRNMAKFAKAKSSLDASRLTELEVVANNRFTMQREELGETLKIGRAHV